MFLYRIINIIDYYWCIVNILCEKKYIFKWVFILLWKKSWYWYNMFVSEYVKYWV